MKKIKISNLQKEEILKKNKEFKIKKNQNYNFWFMKRNGISVHIYENNTLLAQGDTEQINSFFFSNSILDKETPIEKRIKINYFGGDESGVGDIFGPIVVTIFFINNESLEEINQLKIKDSKEMTTKSIIEKGLILSKMTKFYRTKIINNKDFNEIWRKSKNLKEIILEAYLSLIKDTKKENIPFIIDAFIQNSTFEKYKKKWNWKINQKINFITKAENKYLGVAASSIISRFFFLKEIEKIEKELNLKVIIGANKRAKLLALKLIQKIGAKEAQKFIKNYNLN